MSWLFFLQYTEFGKIGDAITNGNAKELRNQVFVFFKTINRHYKDNHHGNTVLHMICQEGYYTLLEQLFNPANRSGLDDDVFLEVNAVNDRNRTPLFLCFTPPSATSMGMTCGLDPEGNIDAEKRKEVLIKAMKDAGEDISPGKNGEVSLSDWIKPGGPKSRENCIKLLVREGALVNSKDFQGFSPIHFAAIWGWTSTIKFLLQNEADINAQTDGGKTALSLAVDNMHDDSLIPYLCSSEVTEKYAIKLDLADSEGNSPLILVVLRETPNLETMKLLLERGADPDHQTIRKKTALLLACKRQLVDVIMLLLDFNCNRDQNAFNLLRDTETLPAATLVQQRLTRDERLKIEAQQRAEKEEELARQKSFQEKQDAGRLRKSIAEAWLEYRDSVSQKPFYYNTVTRQSTMDKPRDFKPKKDRLVPERRYGLHFYH